MAFVFLLWGFPLESQTMPRLGMDREPTESARERGLPLMPRGREEAGDRLRGGLLGIGASEPCLLGLPGPGPKVPYLGATPDSTAEGGIVAGNDGAVHQRVGEAWGLGEVQGLVVGWLICDACW